MADHFIDLLLANLKGQIRSDTREYMSVKAAIDALGRETQQDFGEDLTAWEEYLRVNYDLPSNKGIRS